RPKPPLVFRDREKAVLESSVECGPRAGPTQRVSTSIRAPVSFPVGGIRGIRHSKSPAAVGCHPAFPQPLAAGPLSPPCKRRDGDVSDSPRLGFTYRMGACEARLMWGMGVR